MSHVRCHNCGNNAMFMIGPKDNVPVCLDCYVKWAQVQQQNVENLERLHNLAADAMESSVGLSGLVPRYPPRSRPTTVISGGVTLRNISISNSNVGVVSSGTIGTIDGAIGLLRTGGQTDAAAAFKAILEAVIASPEIEPSQKREISEMLSVLATEAAAPPERRRSSAMRAILGDVAKVLGTIAALSDLWARHGPAILALFAR